MQGPGFTTWPDDNPLDLEELGMPVRNHNIRPRAYPRVEHQQGASLRWAPALATSIRLSYRGLPGANTLAEL